jgi:hypothetical protein
MNRIRNKAFATGLFLIGIAFLSSCNQVTTDPVSEITSSENVISTRIGDLEFTDDFA